MYEPFLILSIVSRYFGSIFVISLVLLVLDPFVEQSQRLLRTLTVFSFSSGHSWICFWCIDSVIWSWLNPALRKASFSLHSCSFGRPHVLSAPILVARRGFFISFWTKFIESLGLRFISNFFDLLGFLSSNRLKEDTVREDLSISALIGVVTSRVYSI